MEQQPDIASIAEEVARSVKSRLSSRDLTSHNLIPVGVSGRHMHLTREVLDALFGKGYQLQELRKLSQPGEFAARETVTLVGPGGRAIEKARILGPLRNFTQIELARSDGLRLGVDLPVRKSGDVAGSPGLTVVGPRGTAVLKEGAIRATRHIHMTPQDAERFGVRDGQMVRARIPGERGLTLDNVLVRVSDGFLLDFHLDTDDANAAGVGTGCYAEILP